MVFSLQLQFERISGFPRGTLSNLLADAYSFDRRYEQHCHLDWAEFDRFFFDHSQIADRCGFLTILGGEVIGFVTWDPRSMPEYAIVGHNCIAAKHKENGYGKVQLLEAVCRIRQDGAEKIVVTTDDCLIAAQRMYESAGFTLRGKRTNGDVSSFIREFFDYELCLKEGVS